ncbi:spermidine/putrescine ABC transporter ATPase [Defluviimonas sp. 20V17]|uniref:Fe3+/spermidine/putrescine ABC transporter ATP-binding protein n=1 Tax=Allgaiera indica TaxID=765699 RepID=A0AAN5A0B9_9RHOB|nr:ABC transporter ATP-binding protein [Allgaiera indica]KDB01620.1 spermidine/putrescine ABC transporter ATPase [Defluviimonas sp. 20V17]GHE03893.1 Fe3+/spermidine/putrescine ABC transporter ATP-binding protein [Allgaiera indica]SDX36056.1 iron(III) transport system ATP-binding protein [Allgaiera indica]
MRDFDPHEYATDTADTPDAAVRIEGVSLRLGQTEVLRGIDLTLKPGRVLALLGPSGCGKTTVLRLVAGMLAPDRGRVTIRGAVVADGSSRRFVPPEHRGLGMVFQDYALWPHLSVAHNVSFPLEMQRIPAKRRDAMTHAALARVGLSAMAKRRPADLSGGQQQRVAIARAVVGGPGLVLFDEPLSNLDRELREAMIDEIAGLVADLGLTALYVTHDHAEAFSLAHEVAVMRAGRIEQIAAPEVLVDRPATPDVARFLRLGALLPVERAAQGWCIAGGAVIAPHDAAPAGSTQVLLAARLLRVGAAEDGAIHARVLRCLFRGDAHLATVRLAGGETLQVPVSRRLDPGQAVGLRIAPSALRWFP